MIAQICTFFIQGFLFLTKPVISWSMEFKLLAHRTPCSEVEATNAGRTVTDFIAFQSFLNSMKKTATMNAGSFAP